MRRLLTVGIASCLLTFSPGTLAHAQNTSAEKPPEKPFSIEIIRTDVPEAGRFHRPIVTVGTNKFYFMAPRGFRIRADEEQRRVYLEDPDGQCSITLRLRLDLTTPKPPAPASPAPEGTKPPSRHDPFREPLLQQYGGARIIEEYDIAAGGLPGAAFDLDWKTPTGLRAHARVCYVPTVAGVFEFVLLVDPAQLSKFHGAFNSVLITFRLAPPGEKVVLPPIPSRS